MDPNLLLAKNQLQRPHSFVSDSDLTSSFDTTTLSSGTTFGGIGTVSGRLIESLGSLVIRTADDFAIRARLISIRRTPGLEVPYQLWDDLLEFSRRDVYSVSIRRRTLEIFMAAIRHWNNLASGITSSGISLISRVLKLPQRDIEGFVVQIAACLPDDRLDYFRRETVHEDVRNRFRYSSTSISELREGTAHFALLLDTLISEASSVGTELASSVLVLNQLLRSSLELESLVFESYFHGASGFLALDLSCPLKVVAFGGPMWVKLGNFLNMQCSRTDAQRAWSKMTTAILQPSSRQFFEYKEIVSRYRGVDPTIFFIEFCAAHCPILIKDFCDLGLDSFFLLLLNNLLPGPLFCELNPQEQKETLANTVRQLLSPVTGQTGYGTVDEERCICNVIFIALLAMSLIHDSQEDEHTKLRYQACVRSILISVRNHDLDFWDACVSYRTVLGAGTEVDPNILLALFRLQEKLYNVLYEVKSEEVSFEHSLRRLLLLLEGRGLDRYTRPLPLLPPPTHG